MDTGRDMPRNRVSAANSWEVCYYPDSPPEAKNLFFSHYALFQSFVDEQPEQLEHSRTLSGIRIPEKRMRIR